MFSFKKKKVENNKKNKEKTIKRSIDAYTLRRYRDSIYKYIPYDIALDKNTLVSKNGGFIRVLKVKNFDTNYLENTMIDYILNKINNTFKRLDGGVTIHYETIREKAKSKSFKPRPNAPIPTQLGNLIRYNKFKNEDIYVNNYYITFTYINRVDAQSKIQDILLNNKNIIKKIDEAALRKEVEQEWENFETAYQLFLGGLKEFLLEYEPLEGDELTTYLSRSINPFTNYQTIKFPPLGYQIDEAIAYSEIDDTEHFKVGDKYVKIISPTVYPTEVTDRYLEKLESVEFPIRICHRFIMIDKEDAIAIINRTKQYQNAKKTSLTQNLIKAIDKEVEVSEDEFAKEMANDAHEALADVRADNLGYGYHTMTIIIEHESLEVLTERLREIFKITNSLDITVVEDKYNSLDAYMGAMPGNITANIRRLPINTYAWSYLIPTSNEYLGNPYTKHRKDECLIDCTNSSQQLFHFDNMIGDVGHTLILGITGSGKSTLLGTIAMNFLKYDDSQLFFFDVGASSRVLTNTSGGKFYDLGDDESKITFQPLRRISESNEKIWALDWILGLLEQEDEKLINPENKQLISEALTSLGSRPVEDRTMTNLVSFIQNPAIKIALKPYTKAGLYGRYFDGSDENIDDAKLVTFEMDGIMKLPKVISPALAYLFHLIECRKLNKGKPTMLILDECWLFLQNKQLSSKLLEWLKVLRKKNASVIFATQSGSDILNSNIKDTIIDQCFTKIFLANPNAMNNWKKVYNEFNLNDKEIYTISQARMKMEYFVKSGSSTQQASALFRLNLTPIELCYVGASDTPSQNAITKISQNLTDLKKINLAWLKSRQNLGYISEKEYAYCEKVINNIK